MMRGRKNKKEDKRGQRESRYDISKEVEIETGTRWGRTGNWSTLMVLKKVVCVG